MAPTKNFRKNLVSDHPGVSPKKINHALTVDRIYRKVDLPRTLDRAIVKTQTHLDREISMSTEQYFRAIILVGKHRRSSQEKSEFLQPNRHHFIVFDPNTEEIIQWKPQINP